MGRYDRHMRMRHDVLRIHVYISNFYIGDDEQVLGAAGEIVTSACLLTALQLIFIVVVAMPFIELKLHLAS